MEPITLLICGAFIVIFVGGILIGKSCERDEWIAASDGHDLLFRRDTLFKVDVTNIINIKKHYGFFTIDDDLTTKTIKRGVIVRMRKSNKRPLPCRGSLVKIGSSSLIYEVQFAERLRGSKVMLVIKDN